MEIKTLKKNNLIAYGLLIIVSIFLGVMAVINDGVMGGADSYMHRLMAKWSFTYPHLFLDHWGKPIFTILSSPFAQFGLFGSVIFNISATIFTSFISYKTTQSLGVKNPWIAILFTIFTPVLLIISFSSLTEPLFALFLTLAIYSFTKEKYGWSAIIISFIPFIRTEGAIFIPLLFLALIIVQKYKAIPLLLIGTVTFSIIGFWVFHDILWIITRLPYSTQSSAYGSGDIFHFINKSPALFGWPILVLFGTGVLFGVIKSIQIKQRKFTALILLLLSISLGYFSAHSVVWAFGIGSSAGLTRVMAGIAPVVGLVALLGYDSVIQKINLSKTASMWLTILLAGILISEGTTKHRLPIYLNAEEVEMNKMGRYVKENKLDTNFVYYSNPTAAYFLGLDHFSTKNSWNYIPLKGHESEAKTGSIIIWDAHFSPNDSKVSKADLENNTHYKKVKTFIPETSFQVYSGQTYEVILFQKLPN